MTDTPVDESQKTILYGDRRLGISEPVPVQPVWVDAITDVRMGAGILRLGLASIISDGDGKPEARVQARLAMPVETLLDIRRFVDMALAEQEQAKKAAN